MHFAFLVSSRVILPLMPFAGWRSPLEHTRGRVTPRRIIQYQFPCVSGGSARKLELERPSGSISGLSSQARYAPARRD